MEGQEIRKFDLPIGITDLSMTKEAFLKLIQPNFKETVADVEIQEEDNEDAPEGIACTVKLTFEGP